MFLNFRNLIRSYKSSNSYNINSTEFSDEEIGCTFDPLHNIFSEEQIEPLGALEYIHHELKIKNIRLGVRWSKVMETGIFDFGFYRPYFDYCLKYKLKIVLNVGPIKVFRWPEEHIPSNYRHLVRKYDTITLSHPIVNESLVYLDQLLGYLKDQYSKYFDQIIAIQADNENFNRFGVNKLFISEEFEIVVFRLIQNYFPNTPIYINSSALNDLQKVFKLANHFRETQIILGINYYYKLPVHQKSIFLKMLDNIAINKKLIGVSAEKLKAVASRNNYKIEIGELQGEPWLPAIESPGNSFREFVFTLYRSKYLKPKSQSKMIIRYWGIEVLVSKFLKKIETSDNEKIKELIIHINS